MKKTALGFICFVWALSGCSQLTSLSSNDLQIHLLNEPVSLDPTLIEDGVSLRVICNTMQGLVGYDGGGILRNQLAESSEISKDGLKYTFVLKQGAKWSDGKPVTPQDFITSFKRALKPNSRSRLAGLLLPIKGAPEFHAGKSQEIGVRDDKGRLVIELSHRTSYFLQSLTLPVAFPLREDILIADKDRWSESAPVTGFYRIVSHQRDQEYVFEKNSWAPESAPKRIIMRVVSDESTAAHLFDQGKLDVLNRIPAFDFERYRKAGLLRTDPLAATYFLSFNLKKPPFSNREFRKAVAGAINRQELVTALNSGELPARSWVPNGLEGYIPYEDPGPLFSGAVAQVRAQLRKKPLPEISGMFDTGSRNAMVMEKVQQDLLRNLGMKVTLSNLDWKNYVKTLFSDPPPLYRFGWLSPFIDPAFHLRAFVTGESFNFSKYSNPRYDELNRQIEESPPGPERAELIRKAQKIIVDDEAIVVPLYHYVQNSAVSKRVKGFRVNPAGVTRFEDLSIQDAN